MEIKERLQQHIEILFGHAPENYAVQELKDELLANSVARYEDLVSRGMPAEDAYQSVIGSIGNVDELLAALPQKKIQEVPFYDEERRSRSALTVTIAVGLYILAGVVLLAGLFISSMFLGGPWLLLALVVAAALCIIPTCMLVYNAYRWPKYEKKEETMVEDFKKWNNDAKKRKALMGSLSSLLWVLTVILYFVISFVTHAWHISWLIFLIGVCFEIILNLVLSFSKTNK